MLFNGVINSIFTSYCHSQPKNKMMKSTSGNKETEKQVEITQRLISATDTNGYLTYCNDEFLQISGFSRDELIGSPHNIVRHPDMPKQVFAQMWAQLQSGKSWMGIIKNQCKNGGFYWVDAYVTPILQNGTVIGYESVRVKPEAVHVKRAMEIYRRLNSEKKETSTLERLRTVIELFLSPIVATLIVALVLSIGSYWTQLISSSLLLIALQVLGRHHEKRALESLRTTANASDNKLAARIYTDQRGSLAQLQMIKVSEAAKIRNALNRISDFANQTATLATESENLAHESDKSLQHQRDEADMAATAMNEMAASISEVSIHIHDTAQEAHQVNLLSRTVAEQAQRTWDVIDKLANTVEEIGGSVKRLASETNSIQQAADMIQAIADQTNLLALNAAIEAARAGEQGRGFAVVADEVRALATKTRDSTTLIQKIIGSLQQGAGQAVSVAHQGSQEAKAGVDQVKETQKALERISTAVSHIHQMSEQMAAASEEQAHVAEDISRQITSISQVSDLNAERSKQASETGASLKNTAHEMHALVERFKE